MTAPEPSAEQQRPYQLAAAGLHVFPVHLTADGKKAPLVRTGLLAATTDPEQIAEWVITYGTRIWQWGVATGPSGLVVADIDIKHGHNGHQSLQQAGKHLPETLTYQTPSGGQHHVYTHPHAHTFKSCVNVAGLDGIDCRAAGGYVVWYGPPPTRDTIEQLPAPPAWLTVPRGTPGNPARPVSDTETARWFIDDDNRAPATVHTIEATLNRFETSNFGHEEMIRAQGAIIAASNHGYRIGHYEQRLRELWLRPPWNTPQRQKEYLDGLTGGIAKYATDDTPAITAAIIANLSANPQPTADTDAVTRDPDPTEQRINDETARLLIQREARKRLEQLDQANPHPPEWTDPTEHLNGTYDPPTPTVGSHLPSGLPLLYKGAVNGLVGDPEAAKTLLATAIAVDELHNGGTVAWLDLDHNGPAATIARFRRFGATNQLITDACRFGFPEDQQDTQALINDITDHPPTLVVIDSIGELLPYYGANSNDSDDYTRVHQQVMKKAALAGAAVLTIDHLSKGADSRNYGATGSIAKKRAYDGLLLRVNADGRFTLGNGGKSDLRILKDRHGALREEAGTNVTEPILVRFVLTERENGATSWELAKPGAGIGGAVDDVAVLDTLNPPPASVRDLTKRTGWGTDRARVALKTWRGIHPSEGS